MDGFSDKDVEIQFLFKSPLCSWTQAESIAALELLARIDPVDEEQRTGKSRKIAGGPQTLQRSPRYPIEDGVDAAGRCRCPDASCSALPRVTT